QLLSQKGGSFGIAVLVGGIHRQVRQGGEGFDGRPFLRTEAVIARISSLAAGGSSHHEKGSQQHCQHHTEPQRRSPHHSILHVFFSANSILRSVAALGLLRAWFTSS